MRKHPILLQINEIANSGSTGVIAEGIGRLALKDGWRSVIAYGRWANPSQSELIRIGSTFDVYEHAVESRLFDNHGLASRRATKHFVRQIENLNPDIIHLHNIHGYYINYRILFEYLASSNIPVVWTFHDCWPMTGHCVYFDYSGCERWISGCEVPCPWIDHYPISYGIDACKRNWHLKKQVFNSLNRLTIVPVSEWLSSVVKKSYFKDYPIRVIHNGVNREIFYPHSETAELSEKFGLKNKKVAIGVANGFGERKGFQDFMKLRAKLPENVVIVMIGLNRRQIKNLPQGIIGIEHTESQDELAQWYSLADVVLNLSYEETFGMITIEGYACGTPVIAYNKTACPELVKPETGAVVDAGNIEGVATTVNTIIKRGKGCYYESCLKYASSEFDSKVSCGKYISLYEELLNIK